MAADADKDHRAPALGVPAADVRAALAHAGVTHVVLVPDTHQRTVLELLDAQDGLPLIRCAAEDDVFGVCAGLWLAGHRPLALIQQLGIFAGANALRGMVHDQRVPIAILAGLYGRDVTLALDANPASAVRLCTPLLDALEIPWLLVERPADADAIGPALAAVFDERHAGAVLLGAPTT
jgi:sulfopyruvate decarboxylase TPP-binding subunit